MLPIAGELPTTASTLFTVFGESAKLNWLQVVNGNAAQAIVQFWVTVRGIQSSLTPPINLEPGAHLDALEGKTLRLDKNALITGSASVEDCTYLVAGDET